MDDDFITSPHGTEDIDALAADVRRVASRYADPKQFLRDLVLVLDDHPVGVSCCLTPDDIRVILPDNPDRAGWLTDNALYIRYHMLRAGFAAAEDIRPRIRDDDWGDDLDEEYDS